MKCIKRLSLVFFLVWKIRLFIYLLINYYYGSVWKLSEFDNRNYCRKYFSKGLLMICHFWSFPDYSLFSIIRNHLFRLLIIHNDWFSSPDTCSPITRRVNAAFRGYLDSPSGVVHPSTLIWSVGYFKPSPSHPSDGGNSIWPLHGVCVVILFLERNWQNRKSRDEVHHHVACVKPFDDWGKRY